MLRGESKQRFGVKVVCVWLRVEGLGFRVISLGEAIFGEIHSGHLYRALAKEISLSYHNEDTILFTIGPYHGNSVRLLNTNPTP